MTESFTSIPQSKKLITLGLDPDTADMYWEKIVFDGAKSPFYTIQSGWINEEGNIRSWSITALLELIPGEIKIHKDYEGKYSASWNSPFENISDDDNRALDFYESKQYNGIIDALIELITYIIAKYPRYLT